MKTPRNSNGVLAVICKRTVCYAAAAPDTTSIISFVIAAWRIRFMFRVRVSISSAAFFDAESIAVIREPCSDATDSSIPL